MAIVVFKSICTALRPPMLLITGTGLASELALIQGIAEWTTNIFVASIFGKKAYKLTGKENVFFTALVVYLEFSVNFMLTRF